MQDLTNKTWVAEWSHKQQCFHVCLFTESLAANRNNYIMGRANDYIVVAVCESSEDACIAIDKLKIKRHGIE